MSRPPLATDQRRCANLAIRLRASLNDALEQAVQGRKCNKSELVTALLEEAAESGQLDAAALAVEASKVRKLTALTLDEVVRRLQAVEQERSVLRSAVEAMKASAMRRTRGEVA